MKTDRDFDTGVSRHCTVRVPIDIYGAIAGEAGQRNMKFSAVLVEWLRKAKAAKKPSVQMSATIRNV